MTTRLHDLHAAGKSLWLDYIDRTMLLTASSRAAFAMTRSRA